MLTARVSERNKNYCSKFDPTQTTNLSGIVVWQASTSSHAAANYVLQYHTFKAYPIYRNAFFDVGKYIHRRKDEIKSGPNVFPFGTSMLFDIETRENGQVSVSRIIRAERSVFFNAARMMRGFAEDSHLIHVDLLNVKLPMEDRFLNSLPPGVPFVGSVGVKVDINNHNPYAKVELKVLTHSQFTMEEFYPKSSGWKCRKLGTLWDEMVTYSHMPGFLKTSFMQVSKMGTRKVLMYTDTGYLFDYERPNVPIIIFHATRAKPNAVVHGKMIRCYLFESCLTDYLYAFTSYRRKRVERNRLFEFEKNRILFERNIRVFEEAERKATEIGKEIHDKPVVLVCNVADQGSNYLRTGDLTYFFIQHLREAGFSLALQGDTLRIKSPHSVIREIESSQGVCPHTDGLTSDGFKKCFEEIYETWGRLDFIVMLSDGGAAAESLKFTAQKLIYWREYKTCKYMVDGVRELVQDNDISSRFLHVHMTSYYMDHYRDLKDTMRATQDVCNQIFSYSQINFAQLCHYFTSGACGVFSESEAVVRVLQQMGEDTDDLNDQTLEGASNKE